MGGDFHTHRDSTAAAMAALTRSEVRAAASERAVEQLKQQLEDAERANATMRQQLVEEAEGFADRCSKLEQTHEASIGTLANEMQGKINEERRRTASIQAELEDLQLKVATTTTPLCVCVCVCPQ